jgi:DNA invertase Pin-like site-specific DNA recombinase
VAKQRGIYKGRKLGATKAKPQRARKLRDKGMTLPEIAQALSVDKRTVSRYLKRGSA